MRTSCGTILAAAMFAVLMVCNVGASPLIAMRLRADDTETSEIWKSNFSEIARHPGCCDEIWFSTGCGAPSLDWHRARAAVIADAMADAKAAGITPSLQFQATLGHGDRLGTPEMFSMKTWTGWTGWSGIETKYCNCPRQPAFHAYLREVAKIYAPLGFASLWIDDDLRIANHQPSDSYGRHIGCWCKMCLTAFNSENGATWTREKLAKAVETDDALFARWRKFSVDGLCIVARTIAETFHELSPDTMMALQHASGEDSADQVVAVLKELHEISGHFVGFRPGGGNYYDDDPNGVICKSIGSGWFRNRIGDPCYVKVWTPEIESWPRTYYSRSPQGVLVEGFAALMSGMNSVSFFISNSAMEDPALYGRTYWKSLAEASPVLHGYAKTIDGCTAVGFIMPGDPQIGIRRTAIPVLAGPGRSFGELTTADCERNVNMMTSSEVQGFRDELDRRAGGLPALVQSPFIGLMQVHVDGGGNFRCLALLNLRISEQGPVRILLRKVPSEWTHVVWNEMRCSPVRLPLEKRGDDSFVTISLVGAWNGGYLSGVSDFANGDKTVFIEAESFDDWGGWVNDTQFMDQMGSPYLLAHGMGKPVADAKTTFVANGGKYNVWVRTKNWTSPWHPDVGAGTFKLVVNGNPLPNLLGCQGKGEWLWVKADDVTLKEGKNTLALHDLDGFNGRVDAICFTTNPQPTSILNGPRPPSVIAQPIPLPKFDLCVVGGGIAGICTAVSAARLGLSVALVQDRPVLGGNNSSEVRVHLGAYQNIPPYPRLGDVLAEFGPTRVGNAESAANYEDERKLAIIKAEKNINLFLNEHVSGVKTNEMGRILSVRSVNTKTGVVTWFEAANFVDCTGDGTVGYLAGADYRMGREAKSETNEPDAPEKADMITMGASVQWNAGKTSGDASFPFRPWMLKTINEENCSPHLKGDWWWEAGFGRDQIAEGEYIRDYGLLVAYSNWAFVKNSYSKKDAFADKELKWVAYNAGRRESRRLLGDFILDQNHLRKKDFQPDGTCATTWTIDLHLPMTAEESKFEGEPYQSNSLNEKIWPYPIPYRCLYSRNVPNLFMAGRDISVTHIALGTTRLMRTHGMMGEVVGMAASICKKHGCNPRDVYTTHLGELKELMTKGVGDGKEHPRQDYNVQQSLDPDIKTQYEESVKGQRLLIQ